jgi:hypothetical protein
MTAACIRKRAEKVPLFLIPCFERKRQVLVFGTQKRGRGVDLQG